MWHNRAWRWPVPAAAVTGAALAAVGAALYAESLLHGAPSGGMPPAVAVVGAFLAALGATHIAVRTALAWRPRRANAEVGLATGIFYVLMVAWVAAVPAAAERVGDAAVAAMALVAVAWLLASVARLARPVARLRR